MVYISSACSHQQVSLQTIFSSNNCAIREPVVKPLDSPSELNDFFESLPVNFSQTPMAIPEVDYAKQTLVLYALGQKPTSGYSIELYRDYATIKKQTLYLPVRVQHPESGRGQAQMITSPCQVYALPHVEYSEIAVEKYVAD